MIDLVMPLAFQEGTSAPGGLTQFIPLILIFAIFYFLLIAPMRKKQKALQAMISALEKGDKVVTTGGIYGEVAALEDESVLLKVSDDVKIKVARSAISGLQGQDNPS